VHRLARPVINLGFGGNGEMEASVGRLIAELKQVRKRLLCALILKPEHLPRQARDKHGEISAKKGTFSLRSRWS
jgi:hypothetical protein